MSLYYVQKFIYGVIRDDAFKEKVTSDMDCALRPYSLSQPEADAIRNDDIGLLYVMGVNGQLLMHYAAWRGFAWDKYMEAMRGGLRDHGKVRAGVYAAFDDGAGAAS